MTFVPPRAAADILAAPPELAAPRLLGAHLLGPDGVEVRIVEVEAYGGTGSDPASHAHRGRSRRNDAMFGPVGHLYAYRSYGIHVCLNVVSHPPHQAGGILLRAGELVAGAGVARRGRDHLTERLLASGPGRLGEALGYEIGDSGRELLARGLLRLPAEPVAAPRRGPRVGISKAADRPWRFWLDSSPVVTPYRRGKPSAGEAAAGVGADPLR